MRTGKHQFKQTCAHACPGKFTITAGGKEMLSRDCDGCSQMKACSRRFLVVEKGDRVYCPDGTTHLVDGL